MLSVRRVTISALTEVAIEDDNACTMLMLGDGVIEMQTSTGWLRMRSPLLILEMRIELDVDNAESVRQELIR